MVITGYVLAFPLTRTEVNLILVFAYTGSLKSTAMFEPLIPSSTFVLIYPLYGRNLLLTAILNA